MEINKLIKESHENAIEKGFHDCPECGCSTDDLKLLHMCQDGEHCETSCEDCEISVKDFHCQSCNGTGINQNKNIPELLMLVITEISEAVEALRNNRIASNEVFPEFFDDLKEIEDDDDYQNEFEAYIKDTFEDEIADTFIRLFDLCGYLEIEIELDPNIKVNVEIDNIFVCLLDITERIINLYINENRESVMQYIFFALLAFCDHNNIDIEKHITAKMQYNKTRPKKHGKEF